MVTWWRACSPAAARPWPGPPWASEARTGWGSKTGGFWVCPCHPGDQRPRISFGGTVSALDECQAAVREALGSIAELAEVEAILWRLAEELKRTIRRTNALNYMIIPTYQETIHYLEGALEEREREGLFHLKRVKARKSKQ